MPERLLPPFDPREPFVPPEPVANTLKIKQMPPRQDSLRDQLGDLYVIAARIGAYDAADWLWKRRRDA